MNSNEIYRVIETIAATPSKNAKQAIIERHKDDDAFINVIRIALNTFITFGVNAVPSRLATISDGKVFDESTEELLQKLSKRELTGNDARSAIHNEIQALTPESAELLTRILKKDLRAGFSASTVNKAIPGTIPTFDCMLAEKFDAKRIKTWPQIAEPKLDGVRVLAFVNTREEEVHFMSRSGKEFTTFDHIKKDLVAIGWHNGIEEFVFDGEMISGDFNKTVGDVRRKSEQAVDAEFFVFDVIRIEAFTSEDKGGHVESGTYTERREALEKIFRNVDASIPVKLNKRYLVGSVAEIEAIYTNVRNQGLEGLIIKDPKALYHRRRNVAWMKIKNEESVDVEIVGYEEGTGKAEGSLGAFIIDYKGKSVNVGSGLTDEQRRDFWDTKVSLIGRIIEVEFHEETPDGSLRHPRFVRFRDTLEHGTKE